MPLRTFCPFRPLRTFSSSPVSHFACSLWFCLFHFRPYPFCTCWCACAVALSIFMIIYRYYDTSPKTGTQVPWHLWGKVPFVIEYGAFCYRIRSYPYVLCLYSACIFARIWQYSCVSVGYTGYTYPMRIRRVSDVSTCIHRRDKNTRGYAPGYAPSIPTRLGENAALYPFLYSSLNT